MRASGSLVLRMSIAAWKSALKLATEVIVASLLAQASLAPIRIVTYSTLWPAAVVTWPGSALITEPDLASLKLLPLIAGFAVRMRL